MWDVRKAIIELIEPYMDKTLSEWCLVELWKWEIIKIDKVWLEDYYFRYTDFTSSHSRLEKSEFSDINIIWHYDITAVLKYIENTNIYDENSKLVICKNVINFYELNIEIPNKPLHLYSEQEEKELLDILTKLK